MVGINCTPSDGNPLSFFLHTSWLKTRGWVICYIVPPTFGDLSFPSQSPLGEALPYSTHSSLHLESAQIQMSFPSRTLSLLTQLPYLQTLTLTLTLPTLILKKPLRGLRMWSLLSGRSKGVSNLGHKKYSSIGKKTFSGKTPWIWRRWSW